ncbi:MAG: hypothetical protein PHP82_03600 [Candidatus ainarchaeum sp.]|nr:hypothetical protein [Candidatus ainarchaeum sp.]
MVENSLDEKGSINLVVNESDNYWKRFFLVIQGTHLLAFKYPKLIIFSLCIVLAIIFFQNDFFLQIVSHLGYMEYAGVFISGLLFSFGFTTPFATAVFIIMKPENVFLIAILAGFGAVLSDLIIFKFVNFSFEEEFQKLRKERPFLFVKHRINSNFKSVHVNYFSIVFAGILLASPLPDEAGITILAGLSKISIVKLIILSFFFKTIGILILLLL